jgi:hypothetical protein
MLNSLSFPRLSWMAMMLVATTALAEPQFPDWDKVCPDDQREWGFNIYRGSSTFPHLKLTISPKFAPYFTTAQLRLVHSDRRAEYITVDMGFTVKEDGSKEVIIAVGDRSFDEIALTVFTDSNMDAVKQLGRLANISPRIRNCSPENAVSSFAGFTFMIPPPR